MTAIGDAQVERTLPEWSLAFVEPTAAQAAQLPEQWRPIALAADAGARCRLARSLWSRGFLAAVPRFAAALATRCADVRACIVHDCPALVYVMADDDGGHVSWVGYDPREFGPVPEFWQSFPASLRVFLREVHAGFVSGADGASFGPARPVHMVSLARFAGFPEGIPGWDEDGRITSTRLLRITSDGGNLHYCLSPDLAPGDIALVYEGDIDPADFGTTLDELMMSRFEART